MTSDSQFRPLGEADATRPTTESAMPGADGFFIAHSMRLNRATSHQPIVVRQTAFTVPGATAPGQIED